MQRGLLVQGRHHQILCCTTYKRRSRWFAEPSQRLIPLDLSGDGDSASGAHAVGNACDALGCLGGDSVSCACYTFDGC
jgi:hypothetical protein